MKIFLLLLIFMTFSTQAFSKHNYYDEYCQFDSPKGVITLYKRIYWLEHHMSLISDVPGLDNYPSVYLPGNEAPDNDDPVNGEEVMTFSEISDFNKVTTPYDDGCWEGFTTKFERVVKIEDLKPIVTEAINFRKNDHLQMKCNYEHLEISGDKCDEL